jgi:formylglycine-generating enzyme required for sulfatase activity
LFTGEGNSDELPRHAVYVDAFYMDTYEVTNQQYADALNWAWAQGNLIQVTDGVVRKRGMGNLYCDTTTSSSYSRSAAAKHPRCALWPAQGVRALRPSRGQHPESGTRGLPESGDRIAYQ